MKKKIKGIETLPEYYFFPRGKNLGKTDFQI